MVDTNLKSKVICQTKLNKYFIYLTVIPKKIAEDILEIKKGDRLSWYINDEGNVSIKKYDNKKEITKLPTS